MRRRPRKNSWPESGPKDSIDHTEPEALSGREDTGGASSKRSGPESGAAMLRVQSMIGNRATAGLVGGARHRSLFEHQLLVPPEKEMTEAEQAAAEQARKRTEDAAAYVDEYFAKLVGLADALAKVKRKAFDGFAFYSGHWAEGRNKEVLELLITALSKAPGALPLLSVLELLTRGGLRMRRFRVASGDAGKLQRHLEFHEVQYPDDVNRRAIMQLAPVREHLLERLGELGTVARNSDPVELVKQYLEDSFGNLPDPKDLEHVIDRAADEFELLLYRRFYGGRAKWVITEGDDRKLKGMPHNVRRRIVKLSGAESLSEALKEWKVREDDGT